MTASTAELRLADWARNEPALALIRREVFIEEQQVPEALEWDGLDAAAVHVLAETRDGTPIGTARLLADGHIGRMAVRAPWRGNGIGRALLEALLAEARRQGMAEVFLHAQTHAIPFYERAGFTTEGEVFLDAGIPHRQMRRPLTD